MTWFVGLKEVILINKALREKKNEKARRTLGVDLNFLKPVSQPLRSVRQDSISKSSAQSYSKVFYQPPSSSLLLAA
ncbi:hypothetical protein PGTUg99_037757 [Puccinia graminis f. sp. tritici]|uniref:Uncharacterized protein n=1 Tax=Puccinia graminis f. sp. tritici TaxID=56615 RepID=A0A5B0RCK0_PUCGR|nr:hypothetical protein PGTUg99_037757 [Puccinia graminis f. sp. tritici]